MTVPLSQGPVGHARGGGATQSPYGSGGLRDTAAATLTSAGSCIHEGAVAPVMEEEVGPILIVTEDIRGTATEDGAHADTPAPWRGHGPQSVAEAAPLFCVEDWLPVKPAKSRTVMPQESLPEASLSPDQGLKSPKPMWRVATRMLRQVRSKTKSPGAKVMSP